MSSNDSLSGRDSESVRSTSSTVSTQPSRRQQEVEAALYDLECSFQGESHSARYSSHVLDVSNEDSEDDMSSISDTRHSTSTAQLLLNEVLEQQPRADCDLDSSESSAGMAKLWKQQQPMGMVDQSLNLMDAKTAKYEEEQPSGLESLRSGLESFCKSEMLTNNSPPFSFPKFDLQIVEEKESTVRKSKIKKSKSKEKKNVDERNESNGGPQMKCVVLVTCFLTALLAVILVTVSTAKSNNEIEGEGVVTAVKSNAEEETFMVNFETKDGDSKPRDNSFAIFEEAANASTVQAINAALDAGKDKSRSHTYEAANASTIREINAALDSEKGKSRSHTYEATNASTIQEINAALDSEKDKSRSHTYEVISDVTNVLHATVSLPAKTRARALLAILIEFEVSNPEGILQKERQSAAYRAMKWISDEDSAELAIPSYYYQSPHTAKMGRHNEEARTDVFLLQQLLQRYVLAVCYFSWLPPSDKAEKLTIDDIVAAENNKRFHKSWLSADHVCHWQGVDCGTNNPGVESISLDTVVTLNLTRHALLGTLPVELFSGIGLPDLNTLDLSFNHLYGTLPNLVVVPAAGSGPFEIKTRQGGEYSLQFPTKNHSLVSSFSTDSQLFHIELGHNQLSGTIPPLLQMMMHCHNLFLNHNQFSGSLKSLLGNGIGQGRLEQIDVGNNLLTGTVPNLSNFTKIEMLSLESNFLSGSLPDIFDKLRYMEELHLNDNILAGNLPTTLGKTTGIARLGMEHNEFSGRIPASWDTMTKLQKLSIHHNALTGELPSFLGSSMQALSDLFIQNNRLGGSIPSELGLCTKMKRLYLEENFFRGVPPSSLGNLQELKKLRLSGNRLTGTMPSPICNLMELEHFEYLTADCKSGHIQCSCCDACF